ncbi:hypothetical protein [Embleya sp. NPDC020886]|uniref:hypothetical protein n=1 Tax=Embleya sp. NPDC020886 TaxID=3363980 RepID=UPI0037B7E8A2
MTSLPGLELLALIKPHTGEPRIIRPTARGFGSDVAALVEGGNGRFFVKAVRNRPGGRRDSLVRERLINPTAHPISPALPWNAEDDEWVAPGFEMVEGRCSDFAPDSPDLTSIVDSLNRIGEFDLPEVAHDWSETRWNRFAADEARSPRSFEATHCSTPTSTPTTS